MNHIFPLLFSPLRDYPGDDDGASRHSKDCRSCRRLTSSLTLDCVCAWTRDGAALASCSSGSVALASEYAAASFESMDVFDATLSVTSASLLVAAVATTAVTASATAESTAAAESAATSRDDANAVLAKAEAMAPEAQAESAPKAQAGTAPEAQAKAAPEAQAEAASEAQAGATPALAPLAVHDALSLLAEGDALPSSSFERRRAAATNEALYRP